MYRFWPIGPMARTVRDIAFGYSLHKGPDGAGREAEMHFDGSGLMSTPAPSLAEYYVDAEVKVEQLKWAFAH